MSVCDAPRLNRREFCGRSCRTVSVAALIATAAAWLDGCGNSMGPSANAPQLPTVNASVSGNTAVVNVDANSPLSNVGSAALVQSSLGLLLAAHTGANTFTAMTSTCTHQACTVSGYANQQFVCPCHGSTYDTSGRVLSGPAPLSLRQFATQFNGGVLTITV